MPGFSELGSPSFSRDGQWIAFDAYKKGFLDSAAECWIARRDGSDLKRLTFGATPRFSPDGQRLLFVHEAVNDASRPEGVYVINRDGTGERRIGPGRWPDWSPDGQQIVFSIGGEETGGARIGARICIADADGSNREEITDGDCPCWSPDGKKISICYRAPRRPPMIHVYDLQENATAELGIGWYRANWTADSKEVVCSTQENGARAMVRMSLNHPRRVIEQPSEYEEPFSPSISWDGKEILFIARRPSRP
jgi:Tol biopolymer transport system component